MLRKRETHIEKQIEEQTSIAKKNVSSNKTVARAALKRKKVFEDNLVVTQKHINTLEQQMNAVETANLNMETIKVMKQAASAMQGMHKGVGVEDIDTTMDEIRDSMTLNKEITEAISSVQETDLDDEDELETLLADMEQKDLDDKMISAPAAPVNATSQAVRPIAKNVEEDEEEELRKLQAEMAM